MDRKVRGSVIQGWVDFVQKTWGEGGLDGMVSSVGLDLPLDEKAYYDDSNHLRLLEWIHNEKGLDAVHRGGRFVVQNLGLLAYLVRFTTPMKVLERATRMHDHVYSFGTVDLLELDPKTIQFIFKGVCTTQERCVAWKGALEGVLKMTRTPGKVEETTCEVKGDGKCTYIISID